MGGGDSCSPFFAPLSDKELQKLKEAKVVALPMRLRSILRKHYTPIRHLFRCFDGNEHGMLTKQELQRSLKCLGVELQKYEVDALFQALLNVAIDEGDVSLSFRSVQKAFQQPERVAAHVLAQSREVRELSERLESSEAARDKASKAAASATARAEKAEAAAAAATTRAEKAEAEAKQERSRRIKAGKQGEGLRAYLEFVDSSKEMAEDKVLRLEQELAALRAEHSAASKPRRRGAAVVGAAAAAGGGAAGGAAAAGAAGGGALAAARGGSAAGSAAGGRGPASPRQRARDTPRPSPPHQRQASEQVHLATPSGKRKVMSVEQAEAALEDEEGAEEEEAADGTEAVAESEAGDREAAAEEEGGAGLEEGEDEEGEDEEGEDEAGRSESEAEAEEAVGESEAEEDEAGNQAQEDVQQSGEEDSEEESAGEEDVDDDAAAEEEAEVESEEEAEREASGR